VAETGVEGEGHGSRPHGVGEFLGKIESPQVWPPLLALAPCAATVVVEKVFMNQMIVDLVPMLFE